MEEDSLHPNGGLRPNPQANMASRFPSLRRPTSSEPYRHRSLPAEHVSGSDGGSETTFAVWNDDAHDYRGANFDEPARQSMHRHESETSFAHSFHTRDSRIFSDDHDIDRSPDLLANQRLLAEGYMNHDRYTDAPIPSYDSMYSQDTLTAPQSALGYQNIYGNDTTSLHLHDHDHDHDHDHRERPHSSHSAASWCTCDEDHAHGLHHAPITHTTRTPGYDVEAQRDSSTPTLLIPETEKQTPTIPLGAPAAQGPGEKGPRGPGGPGGPGGPPGGGPPGLPPFPPGFPDEFKVQFDGPTDPLNPKNWPSKKKWAATACIGSFTFLSPLASSMIAPCLEQIMRDFNITKPLEGQITLSIFVLAYAIGPMVLGPLSELYGRVYISQASNVFFLIFNTLCGFAQSKQQLMAFRFLAGLGGSAPLALGGGVLGDIFKPEERGKAMGIYALGPLLGPALGPLVGGFVAQYSTWRWLFYATSIVNVFILTAGFIYFKETYAPYLLHLKAKRIRKETGNNKYRAPGEEQLDQPVWKKIASTMTRAFSMLFTQPIVIVMSLYMGFSYGILYLMLSTYPVLWRDQYGQPPHIQGLNYISLGLGFFLGAPILGKTNDVIYKKLKAKSPDKKGKPEFRMPLVIVVSTFVPLGLLTYGWSAQKQTFWIVPNIGAFIFAIGTIAAFQNVTAYLVDTYMRYAASAVAAVTVLRSLFGFAFPIFAPAMYTALGFGWGNTALAIAAVGIGIPTPILLWVFGEKLRQRSSLATQAMKMGPPGGPPGGPGAKGPGGPGGPPGKKGPPGTTPLSNPNKQPITQ